MTLAYIINGLLFVMPCIVLLLLVFKDQLKAPTLLRIFTGSTLFVIFSLWGTYIYFLFKTPLQHLLLSVLSMFSGVLIFSGACRYNFWQSLFIIAVIRSCSEIIRFFSYESYFLLRGELPDEPTLEVAFITTLLTILTFPAVRLFFRDLMRPALDYTVSLSAWKWVWLIPLSNSAVYTVAVAPEYSFRSTLTENESFLIPLLWALLTFSTHTVLLKMMIDVSKNAVLLENLHLSEVRIAAQQLRPLHRQERGRLSLGKGGLRLGRRAAVPDSVLLVRHFPAEEVVLLLKNTPQRHSPQVASRKILRLAPDGEKLGVPPVPPRPLQVHMTVVFPKVSPLQVPH